MKTYLLTIDGKIYKAFRDAAKKEGRTMRWLIEQFMAQYVANKQRTRKSR